MKENSLINRREMITKGLKVGAALGLGAMALSALGNSDLFNALSGQQFGLSSDLAVPGDYDDDGKTDMAFWQETNGTFYISKSSDDTLGAVQWGYTSDVPLASYDSH